MRLSLALAAAGTLAAGAANAAVYPVGGDLIGEPTYYQPAVEDNLYEIARRFDVGIVEMLAANPGVDPWFPPPGKRLTITTVHILPPGERKGIVINLAELRLFYYADENTVMTFPIGIGREGWRTPAGTTFIVARRKDPAWIPPDSIRRENPELPEIVPAGPDNPLGQYALNLGWPGYVIHGTNRPYGVGKRSSHGCIRLYPEDIAVLFDAVREGTPVRIVDTAYKLGWRGDTLFLEVTPTQEQSDIIAEYSRSAPANIPGIYNAIEHMAQAGTVIDWYALEQAVIRHDGIPVIIASRPRKEVKQHMPVPLR